ncbi:unnamed protein product [Rotaria socialis]|uniref:Uncharacterized protein n=3 Tax=Rotaria socialis TaxID=392032 RepID=A0A817U3I0_9BILA|nr:unnamed protein product [Rotaria socialis]CAF3197540.1 unnamed protein product [Rotaria socialis]CAF3317834.1 unnamed protein product [Rotaria socialis]CAF3326645.1 unnamed protein product [Rotaria socialis]CAF3712737.1 unnamed protein product [Rotaria socialis]
MTQHYIFFFVLLTCIHFVHLESDHRNQNSNCPHLFKALSDCTCVHSNTIDCSYSTTISHLPRSWYSTNHNLTAFTQSIIRFDLVHTPSITLIKTDDFHGLQNLRYLSIISTGLVKIQPHAFRHLPYLNEIRIEANGNLTELQAYSFSDIEYVHRISLASNSIRVINAEAFRYTHFVDILDLSNNPLEVIHSYAFFGLKSVGSLILCLLPTCPIKQIDPFAFFGFHTCDTILLTGIHTSLRSGSFSHMTSIRLLNLSHGEISRIHSYAFQGSEHIGELDLSSSLISNIDTDAFEQINNISLLNLNGNLIRLFEKSIFQPLVHSIRHINLDNNPIQCDCTLEWYLEQRSDRFKLPDVCTGPIGYECLSPNELQQSQLPCYKINEDNNQTTLKNLCEKRVKGIVVAKSLASLYRLNTCLFVLLTIMFISNVVI